jgi:geranylgeranyl transferase type-1 subunit beta
MDDEKSGSAVNDGHVEFDRYRHIQYFAYCVRQLPGSYSKLDTNRLTLAHFGVHALDMLGVWEDEAMQTSLGLEKRAIIDWIYAMQVPAKKEYPSQAGFKGGSFLGGSFEDTADQPWQYNHGHIAMNYTALATLRTLGDDWSRLDRKGILEALKGLQLTDGSFASISVGSEHDMRFLYCACCISHMLNDWSCIDSDKAISYIRSCRGFDGAIALLPGQESHGGSTFCAVASLVLMKAVDKVIDREWRRDLLRWCVNRQVCGMQGRPNKNEDSCYSYWIGGTLRLLDNDQLLDHTALQSFVMNCQTQMGGFSKLIGAYPDMLHAYYSLAYLSLSQTHAKDRGDANLKDVNCTLGICKATAEHFFPLYP